MLIFFWGGGFKLARVACMNSKSLPFSAAGHLPSVFCCILIRTLGSRATSLSSRVCEHRVYRGPLKGTHFTQQIVYILVHNLIAFSILSVLLNQTEFPS